MEKIFTASFQAPDQLDHPALWFIFDGEDILVFQKDNRWDIPCLDTIDNLQLDILQRQYLGIYEQTHCFAAIVTGHQNLPDTLSFQQLRNVYQQLEHQDFFLLATRAKQILFWDKNTQFCGQCGGKNILSNKEPAKVCLSCGALFYPQVAPVIMVLITRGKEILLARSPHFTKGVYSVLAGFVEPGETAEHAVTREIFEEVGLCVKNIRYVGSQPWPFPSNLMLGYVAEYVSGVINIDGVEIEDADWYNADNLPLLPKKVSLSRYLIDSFFSGL